MIAEALGRLVLVLLPGPEASLAEALICVGLALLVLAAAAVVRSVAGSGTPGMSRAAARFGRLRVLLRADDPAAAGHRMARAPGGAD